MAAGDLTTSATALQWLGLSVDDGTVARLITAMSTQIQKFLGYLVASQAYSKNFSGDEGLALMLPDWPVTAVASLSVDGVAILAAPALPACGPGFIFDDKFIYLREARFCRGFLNVAVSYTAGYAATPFDIEQACLDWLKIKHESLQYPGGVKSVKAGDTAIVFGDAIMERDGLLLPPVIAAALQPYRRVA